MVGSSPKQVISSSRTCDCGLEHSSEAQIQTLLLTNAVTNACAWAVAFHSVLALKEGDDATEELHAKLLAAPATRH